MSNFDQIKSELAALLVDQAKAAGKDLKADLDAVRVYAAARLAHLATCVGQPGYQEAVIAEANNIAMEAAITAIDQAEAADARLVGIVQGALAVGGKVLATAVIAI